MEVAAAGTADALEEPIAPLNQTALRSAEAGLSSLFLVLLTYGTFGPSYDRTLATGLSAAAMVLGVAALVLAHRAGHALRQNPGEAGSLYGWAGMGTGLTGFLVGSALNGALFVLLSPIVLVGLLLLGMFAWALHADKAEHERLLAATYNPADGSAACTVCRQRSTVTDGSWSRGYWMCSPCSSSKWEVSL